MRGFIQEKFRNSYPTGYESLDCNLNRKKKYFSEIKKGVTDYWQPRKRPMEQTSQRFENGLAPLDQMIQTGKNQL